MKNIGFKVTLGIASVILLGACSEGGKLNLKELPSSLTKAATGSEFVSSSSQYETSLTRNYKVQQATGSFTSKMSQTSSPSGYKVYYSVQGAVLSDEVE